jgi:mRNA turnover protein 4
MPTSKRNRVLPTSHTRKDRKTLVRRLHSTIQELATTHRYIYVFSVSNMRNTILKTVRASFPDSRLVMGKTKVMGVALGRDAASEIVPGVSALSKYLSGEIGLFFTDRGADEVRAAFEGFWDADFARAGAAATREVRVGYGEVRTMFGIRGQEEESLPLAIEPQLRKLGMPTRIKGGKVVLEDAPEGGMVEEKDEGYLVCREGETLDSRQTNILKILGVRMAEFRVDVQAVFDREEGTVRELEGMELDAAA